MIEDEATVKSFYREKDLVRLEPANAAYKPIRSNDVHLLGQGRRGVQEGLRMGAVATPARSAVITRPSATDGPAARLFEPRPAGEASLEDSILGSGTS